MKQYIPLLVGFLLTLGHQLPADSISPLDKALANAMQAEAKGQLGLAKGYYWEIASCAGSPSAYGDVPIELARLCGRRSLALALVMYARCDDAIEARSIPSEYVRMRELEPGNATWPFLQADWGLKTGNFDQVNYFLDYALACPYAPEAKAKAREYKAKYSQKLHNTIAAEKEDWANNFDTAAWMRFMSTSSVSYMNNSSSNNSSGNKYDSWNGPANNARKAGDYGAADRLMQGNGTSRDVGLYQHR